MTNRASLDTRTAPLCQDFGLKMAMEKFSLTESELEAIVGRYKKGMHKGKLRCAIRWHKVSVGGWYGGYDGGCVMLPTRAFGFAIVNQWKTGPDGTSMLWMYGDCNSPRVAYQMYQDSLKSAA